MNEDPTNTWRSRTRDQQLKCAFNFKSNFEDSSAPTNFYNRQTHSTPAILSYTLMSEPIIRAKEGKKKQKQNESKAFDLRTSHQRTELLIPCTRTPSPGEKLSLCTAWDWSGAVTWPTDKLWIKHGAHTLQEWVVAGVLKKRSRILRRLGWNVHIWQKKRQFLEVEFSFFEVSNSRSVRFRPFSPVRL